MGSSASRPPDLSRRLRQQLLPLAQSLAEGDGDARLFIFPRRARAKGAQANTRGRNPGREGPGLPSGPPGGGGDMGRPEGGQTLGTLTFPN